MDKEEDLEKFREKSNYEKQLEEDKRNTTVYIFYFI